MERIVSIVMGGGISYVVLSLGGMLLKALGIDYHFSPMAAVSVFLALICSLWWFIHRADYYDGEGLSGFMTNLATCIAVFGGLLLADHVITTIY